MDDELATIASAGAGALGTAMAVDAWREIRTGIARALRMVFRRRPTTDSPTAAAASVTASPREAESGAPAEAAPARSEQTNIAHSGNVFAVQRGDMTVHPPTGQRRAGKR